MKLKDHETWHKLTYDLLYPAILGSMLYDVVNLQIRLDWIAVSKYCLVVLYCLDYLHLFADLLQLKKVRSSWRYTIFDGLIPIIFGFTYWSVSNQDLLAVVIFFIALTAFMFVYILSLKLRRLGQAVLFLLSIIFGIVSFIKGFAGGWYVAEFIALCVVWYTINVFIICKDFRT